MAPGAGALTTVSRADHRDGHPSEGPRPLAPPPAFRAGGVGGEGPIAQASGDPRRPQEAKKYVRPATKEEPELDVMLLVAMGFGLASLFLKVPRSFSPALMQHS